MKTILILLAALTLSNAELKTGIPVYTDTEKSNIPVSNKTEDSNVLQGNISVEKNLPEEIYGTWAVKSTIVETNNPYLFKTKSMDLWAFDRNGKTVTLSNPMTGATGSITVNEVVDKKAKFTREEISDSRIETETPEVSIEGSTFSGTDVLIIKYLKGNQIYKTDVVKYKLEGLKLSGPTMKDLFSSQE